MSDVKKEVIEILNTINSDSTVPRNVKLKIREVEIILKEDSKNFALQINKVMQELDDISEENNIPDYTRTQLWNIASLLETIV
ncbi:UPF0147 family protein [Candidatus Woesearchaeota archaeon]|nr:UPF0147 family protein [Candidatus Woesearchaeota archaeon]